MSNKVATRFVRGIFANKLRHSSTEIFTKVQRDSWILQENICPRTETLVKIFTKMLRDSLREYYPKVRR